MKVTRIFVSAGELPNCPQRKATYAINAHIKTAINNCSAHVSPDARRADVRFGVPVCEIEMGSSCRVPSMEDIRFQLSGIGGFVSGTSVTGTQSEMSSYRTKAT